MPIPSALKAPVKKWFATLGYEVRRAAPPPRSRPPPSQETLIDGLSAGAPLPLWEEDASFQALRRQFEGQTVVPESDSYLLFQFAQQVRALSGDAAEVGVYKGGTARMLAKTLEPAGKSVHLFDTFAGMPLTDPGRDLYHRPGDFADTSLEAVRAFLADCPNVRLHQGLFPQTAGPVEGASFCLVHADVDIYQSELDCCRFFYPRLVRGGVIVFDDYGRNSCPGARAAVDEFFADKPEQPVYLPSGQAFVVKL